MQRLTSVIFNCFIRELAANPPRAHSNRKGVIQSSVGMIFKLTPLPATSSLGKCQLERIQLLFTQRAGYKGDRNAYNIVFPGGQCDAEESDLDACKRQLFQQVGIKVNQQCIYLGQLPSNFYYLEKRGCKVYITCHVWALNQEHQEWKPTLNPAELRDAKWVPFEELIDEKNYVQNNTVQLGILERMSLKAGWAKRISDSIVRVRVPQLNLGMGKNLWGLTLWIWSYAMQMARRNFLQIVEKSSELTENKLFQDALLQKSSISTLDREIKHIQLLEVQFKPYSIFKYPVKLGINVWHTLNRVRPFTYERKPQRRAKLMILAVLLALMVVYSFFESSWF